MIFSKIPNISRTAVKFPYISRFSRQVVTLYGISLVHHVCARSTCLGVPQCINLLGSCCNLLLSQASRHLLSNFRSQCCFGVGYYNRITYLVGPLQVFRHTTPSLCTVHSFILTLDGLCQCQQTITVTAPAICLIMLPATSTLVVVGQARCSSHRTQDHRWPCVQFNCSSCVEQFANGSAVF